MLTRIAVSKAASFPEHEQELSELSCVNFIFGANGSGKTTISRILAAPDGYPNTTMHWSNNVPLDINVFNRDTVKRIFEEEDSIPGVFTLGEQQIETLQQISVLQDEIRKDNKEFQMLKNTLDGSEDKVGKRQELSSIEETFRNSFWDRRKLLPKELFQALVGTNNSKAAFKDELLRQYQQNEEELKEADYLVSRASSVFIDDPLIFDNVVSPVRDGLKETEDYAYLNKKIIGKEDLNIGKLIDRIGNSDWVMRGTKFMEESGDICPFCQQSVTSELKRDILDYFGDEYTTSINCIKEARSHFDIQSRAIIDALEVNLEPFSKFINIEIYNIKLENLRSMVDRNKRLFDRKLQEPSRSMTIENVLPVIDEILGLLAECNRKIDEHNKLVLDLQNQQRILKLQVWRFIIDTVERDLLLEYSRVTTNINRAISELELKIETTCKRINHNTQRRIELEKQTTSVRPTLDAINGYLESFGFNNFRLEMTKNELQYRIVRGEETRVFDSLSEGEKSFISFLYFHHFIKGAHTAADTLNNRVVVIDDPVSSMDSDVLFIVSTLIRMVLEDTCAGIGSIKQVIILTHNVFFHKEVSFSKHGSRCFNRAKYWLLRRTSNGSVIVPKADNPIQDSYDLLWAELRDENRSDLTIQNTMRRILEYYFKILGGVPFEDIVSKFEGHEKCICGSLLSWVHSGSHNLQDDLYYNISDASVEDYMSVFQKIFSSRDHGSHYRMMMKIEE